MKRLHVHISVDDLPTSIRFYNTLFDSEPTIIRHDYAKWAPMRQFATKAAPVAATRSARKAGSPTRRVSGGRRFTRPARAQIIAMAFPRTAARVLAVDLPIRPAEGVPARERPGATAGNEARRG